MWGHSSWDQLGLFAEQAVATHSSTLAWNIPWTEEPGRLQSIRSLRVRHDWVTSLHFSLSCIGEGNGNPLQCSCLENPRDGGAWRAAVYGVAQSRTQLKRLSSSSSSSRVCLTFKSPSFFSRLPYHHLSLGEFSFKQDMLMVWWGERKVTAIC